MFPNLQIEQELFNNIKYFLAVFDEKLLFFIFSLN